MDLNGNLKNKNLIAISGKKQSGKNAIAKIINQLTNNKYEEKCFADKLKDIICILINCTREQLEDESIKSKELGEEWYSYIVKNTYSNKILSPCFLTKEEARLWEQTQDWYEDTGGYDTCVELIKPTPRFLMQYVGTNLFRNQLHPEIWVNSLMNEYKPLYGYQTTDSKINIGGISIPIPGLDIDKRVFPNWCITDMRFPNEMEAVKKRGGITIRVNRPCDICGGSGYHKMSCPVSKSGEHLSETSLDKAEFDYTVNNDSDIQSLIEKIKQILIKERLL